MNSESRDKTTTHVAQDVPTLQQGGIANPLRILHISDLHFGFNFNESNWNNLKDWARELSANQVVVTGDLVNSPWRWKVSSVKNQLEQLSRALDDAPIWVIAGNHDTRISGVVPVRWLLGVSAAFLVSAGLMFWTVHSFAVTPHWLEIFIKICGWVASGIAGVSLLLRCMACDNFAAKLGDPYFLPGPKLIEGTGVGILPVDSSSTGVSYARGRVSFNQLAMLRSAIKQYEQVDQHSPLLWIAAVHHHPLPLPYDDEAERMMVMDNAGALLNELSRAGVRLVLHGHKHHAHFARILVDPTQPEQRELAVLSAGTPTERRNPGAYWHNFNLIEVDAANRIRITMYKAAPNGGTFHPSSDPFDFVPIKQQSEWQFEDNVARFKVKCRRMISVAHINSYGDVRFVSEFRGMETDEQNLSALPGRFQASASAGVIEAFVAEPLSNSGPTVRARPERCGVGYVKAELQFSPSLQKSHEPIDFMTQFHANNAIALNRWQAENMYLEPLDRDSVAFLVPERIAVEEFLMQVRFSDDIALPQRFDARVSSPQTDGLQVIPLAADDLQQMQTQNTVQICVRHPTPGARYEISWDLARNDYCDGDLALQLQIQRALTLRRQIGECLLTSNCPLLMTKLRSLVQTAELAARDILGFGMPKQGKSLQVCLFRFDEETKSLCYLIGNHADDDPRRTGKYRFGLGLPGRAFKTGEVVAFQRPLFSPEERPWMYLHPNGEPVNSQTSGMVNEVAALAFPLAPPAAPEWVYAVLQISTDDLNFPLKIVNTVLDPAVEAYHIAISREWIKALIED